MSPQDALNILKQVALKFSATGQEHAIIAQAVLTLDGVVNPPPKPPAAPAQAEKPEQTP